MSEKWGTLTINMAEQDTEELELQREEKEMRLKIAREKRDLAAEEFAEILAKRARLSLVSKRRLEEEQKEETEGLNATAASTLMSMNILSAGPAAQFATSTSYLSSSSSSGAGSGVGLVTGVAASGAGGTTITYDIDGRTVGIGSPKTLEDRLVKILIVKRGVKTKRHPDYFTQALTWLDPVAVLGIIRAHSFETKTTEDFALLMESITKRLPTPASVGPYASSQLLSRIHRAAAVQDTAMFEKALRMEFLVMNHKNLCLLHYHPGGNEVNEKTLLANLTGLKKEILVESVEGFELYYSCFWSDDWINCTDAFRRRVMYGDLTNTNVDYLRSNLEMEISAFVRKLQRAIPDPDPAKPFIKITEPAMMVALFVEMLANIRAGSYDDYNRYTSTHLPMLSDIISGGKKQVAESPVSIKKADEAAQVDGKKSRSAKRKEKAAASKSVGGGGAAATAGGGSTITAVTQGSATPAVSKSGVSFCMSHLGHLLGVYPSECKYAITNTCRHLHKGMAEVSKADALLGADTGQHKMSQYNGALVAAIHAQLK